MGMDAVTPTGGMKRSPTLFFELVVRRELLDRPADPRIKPEKVHSMQAGEQLTDESEDKLSKTVLRARSSADSASSLPATALQRSSQEDFGADAANATNKVAGCSLFSEDSSYEDDEQQQHLLPNKEQHDSSSPMAASSRSPAGPAALVAVTAAKKHPTAKIADSLQPREILEELLGDLYIDYGRLKIGKPFSSL
jgi:hypothetical protein